MCSGSSIKCRLTCDYECVLGGCTGLAMKLQVQIVQRLTAGGDSHAIITRSGADALAGNIG
jgi:hypothetical protein